MGILGEMELPTFKGLPRIKIEGEGGL